MDRSHDDAPMPSPNHGPTEELKDLVTGILGNADLALEDMQPWQAGYEELLSIRQAAQRTGELVRSEDSMREPEKNMEGRALTASGSMCVLLADDEESVRRVTSSILEAAGFSVRSAANGIEAANALRAEPHRFDIAVLDFRMPKQDGLSALREMRKLRPSLPAVLMSGYDSTIIDQTEVEFLPKPFNRAGLLESVRRALTCVPGASQQSVA